VMQLHMTSVAARRSSAAVTAARRRAPAFVKQMSKLRTCQQHRERHDSSAGRRTYPSPSDTADAVPMARAAAT